MLSSSKNGVITMAATIPNFLSTTSKVRIAVYRTQDDFTISSSSCVNTTV